MLLIFLMLEAHKATLSQHGLSLDRVGSRARATREAVTLREAGKEESGRGPWANRRWKEEGRERRGLGAGCDLRRIRNNGKHEADIYCRMRTPSLASVRIPRLPTNCWKNISSNKLLESYFFEKTVRREEYILEQTRVQRTQSSRRRHKPTDSKERI